MAPPLGRNAKFLLIAGFLTTGSINTVTKKWQFQTCAPTDYAVSAKDKQECPDGEKTFNKPWTQNIQMFTGESLVIFLFLARMPGYRAAREMAIADSTLVPDDVPQKAPFYIFLLPTCCDVLGTGVGGVGMLYISAAVWQMMRGSLLIWTSILSVIILKKKLYAHNWLAVMICATGLALIGVSACLDGGGSGNSNVPLGILLTVGSQFFCSSQMVVEELFVKGYKAAPEQVVGSEGIWGIMIMTVVLIIMYSVPGQDAGSYENVVDSIHMVFGSARLASFIIVYLLSIAFFNFFGVTIAGRLSALHRTINDALRMVIIWGAEMVVFYGLGSHTYGIGWLPHSWLQLVGFCILILGNFVNHAIIRIPGLTYPAKDGPHAASAPREASGGLLQVSMQKPAGSQPN